MMPDLGAYRIEVLTAYAVSLVLLALLIWLSARRAKKMRARLGEVESGRARHR